MCIFRLTSLIICGAILGACGEEPAPRSVSEFVEAPSLLEAALLRCTENRAETRYDPECINVREAVKQIAAERDKAQRAELERQSQRKREALRRTQQAAAEARRRTEEERQRREEAEYLAQFGEFPVDDSATPNPLAGNAPGVVVPDTAAEESASNASALPLQPPGGNQAVSEPEPRTREAEPIGEQAPPSTDQQTPPDLATIRDELRRRSDDTTGNNDATIED